ncbi:YybH family protein [Mitsuokella multacida]|jgi:ketosteroid isomerase-like protein|uniref:YybH family protein n=1 Tax=Mitsuokella multacida TaxID=52226 RepID=UPI0022E734D9|nr:nuclear transport factor 2 family protein [Mitsuokella multacida]
MKHAKSLIPAILAVSVMTGAPALMTEPAYAAEASQSAVAEQQPVAANNGVHTFLSNVDAIDHEIAALKDFQKKDSTALTEKDQNAANQKLTYLRKVKELVYESKDKADFIQNVKAAFPNYAGENDLEMTAAALFPKKQEAPIPDTGSAQDIAAIKKVIDQYADSITNYDLKEAERIWQTDDRTTFIHPRGNEYGWKAIRDHFYGTTMHEHFSKRHLYVRDISIQVYGDSAVAVFYWDFPAVFRTDGTEVTTHGRETQVYERTKDGWKIVHVHYSQMPITGEKQGF